MSGDFSALACNCPKERHTCPHCGQYDEQIAVHFYHIDKCHRKMVGYVTPKNLPGDTAPKSMSPNASHQAPRSVL